MNITIIGGDARIAELAKILMKNKNKVYMYGLETCKCLTESIPSSIPQSILEFTPQPIQQCKHTTTMEEAIEASETIITSIPLSKDGNYINATFSNEKISVKEFFKTAKNKRIITGNITDNIKKYIIEENKNEIIDLMNVEELTVLNAIPTAEGAIQLAMEKSNITLHNSNCLVLGFGRIGKILAKMLHGIGAKVYCEARKHQDIAWIQSYGYEAIHLDELNEMLGKFEFIFNTIPHVILNKENLSLIKKDAIIIDLASKPGGIDFELAQKMELNVEWALALPRKSSTKNRRTIYL